MFFVYISFRSPADVISGLAVLLIQEWKLRVEKGMFAISYLRDKHIYHSDWSIYHNTISITLIYLGDTEERESFLSLKNESEAHVNVVFCPSSLLSDRV